MRAVTVALMAFLGTAAVSAPGQAAPLAPPEITARTAGPELVADGCGRGWHVERYRDRYGYWRTRCVPNRY